MNRICGAAGVLFILAAVFFFSGQNISAALPEGSSGSVYASGKNEEITEQDISASVLQEELLTEIDFTEMQNMVDEMLGNSGFSLEDAVKKLLSGDDVLSKEAVQEFLRGLLLSRFEQEKGTFIRILLLILLAAIFANLANVFEDGQVGEISFYVIYLVLFMILMKSFSGLCTSLSENLSWMTQFMKGLAPAFFLTVAASVGASTAAVFYEGVLLLVWLIQWGLLEVFLPGVNLYVLICLVNHLSREEMLGKLAELLNTAVLWGLRSVLSLAVGLQIVRNLVSPVMDSLKRSAIGKTAGALPGIGNAVNTVTELILTSAVLVRNCLGAVFLIVFLLVGASPVIHYGFLALSYRFLAAVSQPVSDRRIVECLSTMGEGCALMLRIFFTAEVMCMLVFVILMAAFGGGS